MKARQLSTSRVRGGAALEAYPAGAAGGSAAGASCTRGARPSIALRGAARALAPRQRVTAGVGEAGGSGRDARLPEARAGLAARQEPARAAPSPGPARPPPGCASTCGPGSPSAGSAAAGSSGRPERRRQEAALQPPPREVTG